MDERQSISHEEQRALRKKKFRREVREWVISMAAALLIVLVIRTFAFTLIRVDGTSMSPTLENGERLFVTIADVKFGSTDRGDVVICHYPDRGRTHFVKRVVAVPGDSVYRKDGVTHVVYTLDGVITDEALDPEYAFAGSAGDYEPYVLGEDEYFVVGDNRYSSHDSRSREDVGPITGDMLVGRVRQVIWPIDSFRAVK